LYRFRDVDPIPFQQSLQLTIDWTAEFRSELFQQRVVALVPARQWLPAPRSAGKGWVDYAVTTYWYAATPGHDHEPMPPLAERAAVVMRPNPEGSVEGSAGAVLVDPGPG
jgi:hypothetical protein